MLHSILQTVFCPHKIADQDEVFPLPANCTHIKVARPKVRINQPLVEWVEFYTLPGFGFIHPQGHFVLVIYTQHTLSKVQLRKYIYDMILVYLPLFKGV